MTRPLLSTIGIFKDEAATIEEVLASAKNASDHMTLLDTGSTDGTRDIIRKSLGPNDRLHEESFVPFDGITDRRIIDFGKTRNRVIELEEVRPDAAVFQIMISGDEYLHGADALRAFLAVHIDAPDDAYCVTIRRKTGKGITAGMTSWPFPRVLRVGGGRRYIDPIHEAPISKDGKSAGGTLIPDVWIDYLPKDDSKVMRRLRDVDVPVLEHMLAKPVVTVEDSRRRARSLMQLGSTFENLALEYDRNEVGGPWVSYQMRAAASYWGRGNMRADETDPNYAALTEEQHYALFNYFEAMDRLGFIYTPEELFARLSGLAEMYPYRPELRYKIAIQASRVDYRQAAPLALEAVKVAREAKLHPEKFNFPVDNRVEWLSLMVAAECAKMAKRPESARRLAEQGIAAGGPVEVFTEFLGQQPS